MPNAVTNDPSGLTSGDRTALVEGGHHDAFSVLGPHVVEGLRWLRTFQPGAHSVTVLAQDTGQSLGSLQMIDSQGLFVGQIDDTRPYQFRVVWADGQDGTFADPYAFAEQLSGFDLHLISEGRHRRVAHCMGAHCIEVDGVAGVLFATWAPNARRVSVVGDFNLWDGRRHPMRLRHHAGVWELFVPDAHAGMRYKFEIVGVDGALLPQKSDPLARATELAPGTASVVAQSEDFAWSDALWVAKRRERSRDAPLTIYEVHVGSWLSEINDSQCGWIRLAERLIPYATAMGFTHVELMPIGEYPFGGSWGYQPIGLFAPTARYGTPTDFAAFIDQCHGAGLGVIVDWVPAHFPNDVHGLVRFDGTALYEYQDPREGYHRDWNTLIYNFGRTEVRGFLIASALEWLETYHVDGLRVDAVASMLYRDYSRAPGEWLPNRLGGRENLEVVDFLRELNDCVAERAPGAMMIAEESTAWPGVTAATRDGGLGFTYKWNMGWMHDTLHYMAHDPIHRAWHHGEISFGMVYAYSEYFVLPLSHDEVVHGKGSILTKMAGDAWQRFASLRAYYGFMWTHPGKKLIFMGDEIGADREWNHDSEIDWGLLEQPRHAGIQSVIRDLNHLLLATPALYTGDHSPDGFRWVVGDDHHNSVYAYLRFSPGDDGQEGAIVLVVCNFTPQVLHDYGVGVPVAGHWIEAFNSDAACYGGSNVGNQGRVQTQTPGSHGYAQTLRLTLPPLATLILKPA